MGRNSHQLGFADLTELPSPIQEILDQAFAHVKLAEFEKAFASLSQAYRSGERKAKPLIRDERERLLYLATRLPATYAALCRVLQAFRQVVGREISGSALDVGAGPGTFLLAAWATGCAMNQATLVEKDLGWRPWGEKLIRALQPDLALNWRTEDIEKKSDLQMHDLVVLSYSLGELPAESRNKIVERCWELAGRYLILVEPGTPDGFSRIREARSLLLEQGAYLVAPCPHALACPMPANDWCHFSARLQRTSLHRRIKGGDLGYEDEKYSYVVFSRDPLQLPSGRIVHSPQRNKGHVRLQVCREGRLDEAVYSKKQGELYRHACRLEWGDVN